MGSLAVTRSAHSRVADGGKGSDACGRDEGAALEAGTSDSGAQPAGRNRARARTSPRAARFPGDDASWDFGQAASFYLDATEAPWREAYRMESYVVDELPALVEANFPVRPGVRGLQEPAYAG